jgi:predicted RND superfamily exporter protein
MNQMFNAGEPPEGLTARNTGYGEEEFGFGDFGDFGFDDDAPFEDAGLPASPPAEALPAAPPASAETPVTFAMIDGAIGKKPNMSANELVRELQRVTNYDGYSYYEIPSDPERYGKQTNKELQQLVANYLVLLAGSPGGGMSNDPLEPTAIETIILVNSQWQRDADTVMKAVNDYVAAKFPKNVRVLVGGGAAQMGALTSLVTSSQIISLIVAVLAVLVIVALPNRSFAAGLIAALPISIACICNFAAMGFSGVTLNLATVMIASLSVGIGIDYTIHFMETFKREFRGGGAYLRRTFASSGKAILINAVSVGAGFGALAFSQFRVIAQFGGLIALSMGVSAIVSLTVVPVLLTTLKPKFIYG